MHLIEHSKSEKHVERIGGVSPKRPCDAGAADTPSWKTGCLEGPRLTAFQVACVVLLNCANLVVKSIVAAGDVAAS